MLNMVIKSISYLILAFAPLPLVPNLFCENILFFYTYFIIQNMQIFQRHRYRSKFCINFLVWNYFLCCSLISLQWSICSYVAYHKGVTQGVDKKKRYETSFPFFDLQLENFCILNLRKKKIQCSNTKKGD